jgi:hypothetical protein
MIVVLPEFFGLKGKHAKQNLVGIMPLSCRPTRNNDDPIPST